jgi:hypothetical protein
MKNKIYVLALAITMVSVWACREHNAILPQGGSVAPNKPITGTTFKMVEVSKQEFDRNFEVVKVGLAY